MFSFVIDLKEAKQSWKRAFDAHWRGLAGAVFMLLATAAIEYEEYIVPEVTRFSDGWSTAATDFSRRLASFTL